MGNDYKAELVMFGSQLQDGRKRAGLEGGNKRHSTDTKMVFLLPGALI